MTPVDILALARQLEVTALSNGAFPVAERTAKRLRSEIRARDGFREATIADAEALTEWLRDHAASEAGGEITPMVERLEARCRELTIEPPTEERVERIVRAVLHAHEDRFHSSIYDRLVEQDAAGRDRINRVTYEVAVLEALREQLRCKEIWVVGANRYRNRDEAHLDRVFNPAKVDTGDSAGLQGHITQLSYSFFFAIRELLAAMYFRPPYRF